MEVQRSQRVRILSSMYKTDLGDANCVWLATVAANLCLLKVS